MCLPSGLTRLVVIALLLVAAWTGRLTCARIVAGGAGQSVRLLGDVGRTYLEIEHQEEMNTGSTMTIEVWAKRATSSGSQALVSKDGVGTDTTQAYNLFANNLKVEFESNNVGSVKTSEDVLETGQWHHIAVVVYQGHVTIYVDGVVKKTGTVAGPKDNDQPLLIGRRGYHNKYFEGELDEIRIWSTARTQKQLHDNAQKQLLGVGDGLVVNVNFDYHQPGGAYVEAVGMYPVASLIGVLTAGECVECPAVDPVKAIPTISTAPLTSSSMIEDHEISEIFLATSIDDTTHNIISRLFGGADVFSATIVTLPKNGTLLTKPYRAPIQVGDVITNGHFIYVPDAESYGIWPEPLSSMEYSIIAGSNTSINNVIHYFNVASVNDAPVAEDFTFDGIEDQWAEIHLLGYDPDPNDQIRAVISSLPMYGQLFQITTPWDHQTLGQRITAIDSLVFSEGGIVVYVPPPDLSGIAADNFTYSVFDMYGLPVFEGCGLDERRGTISKNNATVTINLANVPDYPFIEMVEIRVLGTENDHSDEIRLTDWVLDADPDDTIAFVMTQAPTKGRMVHAKGFLRPILMDTQVNITTGIGYTPNEDECGIGMDQIRYRVTDGHYTSPMEGVLVFDIKCIDGHHVVPNWMVWILQGIVVGATCLTLFMLVWTSNHRDSNVVRASSFKFLMIILIGALISFLSMLLWIRAIPTGFTCGFGLWGTLFGFSVMMWALFLKEWRVLLIFSLTKTSTRVGVKSDNQLLEMLFVFASIPLVLMCASLAFEPPDIATWTHPSDEAVTVVTCSFGTFTSISVSSFIGITMIVGAIVSFKTRKVKSEFDESTKIQLAIYNFVFTAITLGPQQYWMNDSPVAGFVIKAILPLWTTLVTVAIIYIPKFYVFTYEDDNCSTTKGRTSGLRKRKIDGKPGRAGEAGALAHEPQASSMPADGTTNGELSLV